MPIVVQHLPSFAAAGAVANAAGQGIFEQREDEFQFGQERFGAQLGEQARQFDARTALAARAQADRNALAQQEMAARLFGNQQRIGAQFAAQDERFRQQQELQDQQDKALMERGVQRDIARQQLYEQKFEQKQNALQDERSLAKENASRNVAGIRGRIESQLNDLVNAGLPADDDRIKLWRKKAESLGNSQEDPRFLEKTAREMNAHFEKALPDFYERIQQNKRPSIKERLDSGEAYHVPGTNSLVVEKPDGGLTAVELKPTEDPFDIPQITQEAEDNLIKRAKEEAEEEPGEIARPTRKQIWEEMDRIIDERTERLKTGVRFSLGVRDEEETGEETDEAGAAEAAAMEEAAAVEEAAAMEEAALEEAAAAELPPEALPPEAAPTTEEELARDDQQHLAAAATGGILGGFNQAMGDSPLLEGMDPDILQEVTDELAKAVVVYDPEDVAALPPRSYFYVMKNGKPEYWVKHDDGSTTRLDVTG